MKQLLHFFSLVFLLSFFACSSPDPRVLNDRSMMHVFDIEFSGEKDWAVFKEQLKNLEGISTMSVNEDSSMVAVFYNTTIYTPEKLASSIGKQTQTLATLHEFKQDPNVKACPVKDAWDF